MKESFSEEPTPEWTRERIRQWYADVAARNLDAFEAVNEAAKNFTVELREDVARLLDSQGNPSDAAAVDSILGYSPPYHGLAHSGIGSFDTRLSAFRDFDQAAVITYIESRITDFFREWSKKVRKE
jgi:hypothetical protein